MLADPIENLEPVHAGHLQVQKQQVWSWVDETIGELHEGCHVSPRTANGLGRNSCRSQMPIEEPTQDETGNIDDTDLLRQGHLHGGPSIPGNGGPRH